MENLEVNMFFAVVKHSRPQKARRQRVILTEDSHGQYFWKAKALAIDALAETNGETAEETKALAMSDRPYGQNKRRTVEETMARSF